MTSLITDNEKKTWKLSAIDRCDRCSAEALVEITGIDGSLMFCGHHYNSIVNDPVGYEKMMSFMISIIDERDKLVENKTQDLNYQ